MGNKYSCDNDNIKQTITKINKWLLNCEKSYTITCHFCEDQKTIDMVNTKITKISKCHDIELNDCSLVYILVMKNNKPIGYSAFKIFEKPLYYIDITWLCVDINNRRKGLSSILSAVPIILALDLDFKLIVCDANEMSGNLLQHKFQFIWNAGDDGDGDYIENIGNLVEWQSNPTAYLDLRNPDIRKRTIKIINSILSTC